MYDGLGLYHVIGEYFSANILGQTLVYIYYGSCGNNFKIIYRYWY